MRKMLNENDVNNSSTNVEFSKTLPDNFQSKNNKKEESKQQTDSPESSTKTTFFCSSDEDEENKNDKTNNSFQKNNLPIQSIASPVSDLADGALSDPEVDRQGISPHMVYF
jgi:hypothetical protein